MRQELELSYFYIAKKAWPIILANAAVPLLGIVDTAVIGHFGSVSELAALAVAALVFTFLYWGFGFLRMGTTGRVARALGGKNEAVLLRGILQSVGVALILASVLLLCQYVLFLVAVAVISPPENVVPGLASYFYIRIWAAPATLVMYVASGVFIGRGDSKRILVLQLILNSTNALLDILFAGVFDMGIRGIALGTCIAEYCGALLAVFIILRQFSWRKYLRSIDAKKLFVGSAELLSQDTNIFIRTLFLLASFVFFTHIGARFGEATLAANHILLQFISFSAFFLDGYAHVLESLAGKAVGAGSIKRLEVAFKRTSYFAFFTALLLALMLFVGGGFFISSLTSLHTVETIAVGYVPYAAVYVLLAFAAFQLDGLFIGVSYSRAMRNCSILSALSFYLLWELIFWRYDNTGLWLAFILYVVIRALTLLAYVPLLRVRYH